MDLDFCDRFLRNLIGGDCPGLFLLAGNQSALIPRHPFVPPHTTPTRTDVRGYRAATHSTRSFRIPTMAATCAAPSAATRAVAPSSRHNIRAGTNNLRSAARPVGRAPRVARAAPRAVATETATSAPASSADTALSDSLRPSSADCAKTLVTIATTGTISTACEDGIPLGTFASYVVSKEGEVILRMRADAMHTANINRDARCSLYVQPATQPPGVLSRATLIGELVALDDEQAAKASTRLRAMHACW